VATFPPHQQKQIRLQLASVLRGVISMRLIKRSNGESRIPAVEVLRTTEFIRNCIVEPEKTKMIRTAVAAGTSQYNMQTFDQSIYDHFCKGLITYEDALSYATNPDEFKLRVQGIYSTSTSAIEEMEKEISEFGERKR
jgi:twitching motility protein PilT